MKFWETANYMRFQTFLFSVMTLTGINTLVDMNFSNIPLILFQLFFGVILSLYLFIDGILNFNGRTSEVKSE